MKRLLLSFLLTLTSVVLFASSEIVTLKGVTKASRNSYVLTQKMFTKADCAYIVNQDFDLKGKTVTLPANVKFVFEGGSIRNGVFVVSGAPVEIENASDAVILEKVFFRNETKFGYMDRCCAGICRDTWLKASDDDELLDMAAAFDGIELTKFLYTLSRDISADKNYPNKYRMLAKSYSITSSAGSRIKTNGQIAILRQNMYCLPNDYYLELHGFSIEDVKSDYSYDKYATARTANKAFFGGALNNADCQFDLRITNCSFKGVYQLIQYPCYNGGLNVTMDKVDMYCGGFGLEVYNGDTTRNLKMRVKDCNLESYATYVFSLINVNADILVEDSKVGGLELSHDGTATFRNCEIDKQITHSGNEIRGSVLVDNCTLSRGGHYYDALIFDFSGMKNLQVKNSRLVLGKALFENYSTEVLAGRPLVSFKMCPDAVLTGCKVVEEEGASFNGKYISNIPFRVYEDGTNLTTKSLKASRECAAALSKSKTKIKTKLLK